MNPVVKLARASALPKSYAALVALHVPRRLSDKIAYEDTLAIVDALAGLPLNRDQQDYLDLLGDLIESYEEEHLPALPKLKGVQLLQHLLEENDLTGDDFAQLLGVDRSVAYKILKGSRNLTTDHIRCLCRRFSVRADLFL